MNFVLGVHSNLGKWDKIVAVNPNLIIIKLNIHNPRTTPSGTKVTAKE